MNLYLIERTDDWGYDEYDSVLIAAQNPATAGRFCPFSLEHATWKIVGVAAEGVPEGIVISSFNAG